MNLATLRLSDESEDFNKPCVMTDGVILLEVTLEEIIVTKNTIKLVTISTTLHPLIVASILDVTLRNLNINTRTLYCLT